MRPRHTRRTDVELVGPTVQKALRLPQIQLEDVEAALRVGIPDIHTLTDVVTDALWLWLYEAHRVDKVPQSPRTVVRKVKMPEPGDEPHRPSWSEVDPDLIQEQETSQ